MSRKQYNTEEFFWLKDSHGRRRIPYELPVRYNYYEADLECIFLSLYKGLKKFDKPVVYRLDLYFRDGFSPSGNEEVKDFRKRVTSLFWKANTRYGDRSSFKESQVKLKRQPAEQYAYRFKPIIIWSKEDSTKNNEKLDETTGEKLNRYHYHLVLIAPIFHERLIKNKLRGIWKNVCKANGKGGYVHYCNKDRRRENPVGFYKLYNSDGSKVSITDDEFIKCFKRCTYIAKTKQKREFKDKKTIFASHGYPAYKEALKSEVDSLNIDTQD